jgi:hypothetical protein
MVVQAVVMDMQIQLLLDKEIPHLQAQAKEIMVEFKLVVALLLLMAVVAVEVHPQ